MTESEGIAKVLRCRIELEIAFKDQPATYVGPEIELAGTASIDARRQSIYADLVVKGSLFDRLIAKLQASESKGGAFASSDLMLRDSSPGKLLGERDYARMSCDNGAWHVPRCSNIGSSDDTNSDGALYRFAVQELVIPGPAKGRPVAFVRRVFEGSELDGESKIAGRTLLLTPLTRDAESPEEELVAVTTAGQLDSVQEIMLYSALSFITGNRVNSLLTQSFDEFGELIESSHRRGSGMSQGRNAPFRRFYGPITAGGIELIVDGFTRLHRAGFPIEMVVHHLTEANTSNLDIDGQHLTLAIHTAIEAWNRMFGVDLWIDDNLWEQWFAVLRKFIFRPELKPAYHDIGSEVVSNLWGAGRHANRSTTSWRQNQLFVALGIDVSDEDSKRVLQMRDELLHNGYFLRRFIQLTQEERQQRLDDLARLRNLAHAMVFRLAGFGGECFDFLRYDARNLTPVALPKLISDQQA